MLTVRLRRFVSTCQHQALPLLIALWAGALSLHFTVRACRGLSPADSDLEIVALGALCEVAKLCFGPRALLGFVRASRPWERVGHLALLMLVLVLMAGSVGASFVFTMYTEAQAFAAREATRAQALVESDMYKALSNDIATYDARIEGYLDAARLLRAANQPTQAAKKDRLLDEAQALKDAVVARRSALPGALLPVAATGSGAKRWVHLVVAVVLELVGVAACVLAHRGRQSGAPETALNRAGSDGDKRAASIDIVYGNPCARPPHTAPVRGERFTARYAEARRLIASGSIKPTLDALARAVRVSQRPAQRFLAALCAEGVIHYDGRRYQRGAGGGGVCGAA